MRLIGLTGFKTSGKDTTYEAIKAAAAPAEVWRVGFADKLKQIAARALGFDPETEDLIELMNECKDKWDFMVDRRDDYWPDISYGVTQFTGRQYLQRLGDHGRQVFGDTFWIDQVLPQLREIGNLGASAQVARLELNARYPGADILVVTDVRYENEARRIRELGGELWQITRHGLQSDGHASEIPLPAALIDWYINNDGTIEGLYDTVAAVL